MSWLEWELAVSDEEFVNGTYQRQYLPEPTGTYLEHKLPWILVGFTTTFVLVAVTLGLVYVLI